MAVTINNATKTAQPGWLKSGALAAAALAAEEARIATAKEQSGKMRRFWLNEGEEKIVTFLDGNLLADGSLDFVKFHEHNFMLNGKGSEFICTKDVEPCPICNAGGDNARSSFIGVFTVLVHTPYTIKQGPNAGKVLKDYRQLYAAKYQTLQVLQHAATKLKGIAGWRVEIGRMTGKDAKVGSAFQWMGHQTPAELAAEYGEESQPADYGKELSFLSAAELVKLGLGKPITGPGYETGGFSGQDAASLM
jgi:hypothetical protein